MFNIVFMGTPNFGIPSLRYLHDHHRVLAVVTQPDKPVGRKKILKASPIKEEALKLNLPLFQPEKVVELKDTLKSIDIDFLITAAYGQIIPESILDLAKVDKLNLHGSILPKYRGAAPIQRAIMNGEEKLGVSLMRMVKKMDAGPVYDVLTIPNVGYTSGEAFNKLSVLSVDLLKNNLEKISQGFQATPQDESHVTYARMLEKSDEHLSFDMDAKPFYHRVLALSPEPLGVIELRGVLMKVVECQFKPQINDVYPIIKEVGKEGLTIGLKDGDITITQVKPVGKNMMPIHAFLNGKPKDFIEVGMKL